MRAFRRQGFGEAERGGVERSHQGAWLGELAAEDAAVAQDLSRAEGLELVDSLLGRGVEPAPATRASSRAMR